MQVVLSLRVGGLERVVVDLVNHASDEFRFVVCCLEEDGAWAGQVLPQHGKVMVLNKKSGIDWRMFSRIARLARAESVDLVHTHNSTAHFYGALGGKLAGLPVLHTEHGKNIGQEKRSFRLNRIATKFTNLTAAVSETVAREARDHEGVRADELRIVPNGIPLESFPGSVDGAAIRQSLGLAPTARLVGTVGRLVLEKNYPLLLRAFADLAPQQSNCFLVFVGDGPLRGELEQTADVLGIANRVLFLGKRSDVPQLLGSFDVFVLSSRTEGMSMALLEAMAAGCPIVVTAVGGNIELIQHQQTGLVVPPDDESALSDAMQRLLTEVDDARQLGAAAQASVRQQYSVEQMVNRYQEIYRHLLA